LIEVINGCLDISSCEAGDGRFKLVRGLQKLKNGFKWVYMSHYLRLTGLWCGAAVENHEKSPVEQPFIASEIRTEELPAASLDSCHWEVAYCRAMLLSSGLEGTWREAVVA
jgi:hypothetical protein